MESSAVSFVSSYVLPVVVTAVVPHIQRMDC